MKPDYDKIAWCYDILCYMIFGNTIQKAQTDMLHFIPADCRILIAGGGTGWILEKIAQLHSSGLSITYVDISKRMIDRSKRRNTGFNELIFINRPIEEIIPEPGKYDVIITPFFFDNFSRLKCQLIFQLLHFSLKKDGIWLFADFIVSRNGYWQKVMLKLMYLFFKLICGLEANKLPDINSYFFTGDYKKMAEKMYYKRFIISSVFKKK